MPTNLPPEYFAIEEKYRSASSPEEKIDLLEQLISTVPKHKGTDKLRGDLRRKLSQLRDAKKSRKGAARQRSPFHIDKEGAGQVVVIGPANVGKSSLIAKLTHADPEVSPAPFTTWTPTPGMMPIENVQVQLIDTPPIDRDFVEPEFLDLIRRADLVLIMVDLQAFPIDQLDRAFRFLEEHNIVPAHLRDEAETDRLLASVPVLVLVNKTDDERADEDFAVFQELLDRDWPMVPISIEHERNLDRMKRLVFEKLGIMRIYAKPPGQEADLSAPFVMRRGGSVEEFAGKVHKDFLRDLKSARIWGHEVYDGQQVKRDHILHDGDIVELHT